MASYFNSGIDGSNNKRCKFGNDSLKQGQRMSSPVQANIGIRGDGNEDIEFNNGNDFRKYSLASPPRPASSGPSFAILTALPKELTAVKAMMDEHSEQQLDQGIYLCGKIAGCNVVVSTLPRMGNNLSATVLTSLYHHFPSVTHTLMVGIAGGMPDVDNAKNHVRLGDIVVSTSILQFDYGKQEGGKFAIKTQTPQPSALLSMYNNHVQSDIVLGKRPWEQVIEQSMQRLEGFDRPDESTDVLHDIQEHTVQHPFDRFRKPNQPKVHYGAIASSNAVFKSAERRDKLRADHKDIRAFEMEGAGAADASWVAEKPGCLIIRGICDYTDEKKNKDWQEYAALAAAAYAKELLRRISSTQVVGSS